MPKKYIKVMRSLIILAILVTGIAYTDGIFDTPDEGDTQNLPAVAGTSTGNRLAQLDIKGRAPKTDYSREQFTNGWKVVDGCTMRDRILARDLTDIEYNINLNLIECIVNSGILQDPYTGKSISFQRGETTSDEVQIDHVVALSDAWQKGAQSLSYDERNDFANDPLNLLAVDGPTNQQKGDSDAATWLPPNKSFRCSYVTRQIDVKLKYDLWVTRSEYIEMNKVLNSCA